MSDAVLPCPPAPRRTRRRVEVLMQVSLVIFGALLAFGFGQWKDQRNEDARARVVLDSIRADARAHRDEVEHSRVNDQAWDSIASICCCRCCARLRMVSSTGGGRCRARSMRPA